MSTGGCLVIRQAHRVSIFRVLLAQDVSIPLDWLAFITSMISCRLVRSPKVILGKALNSIRR